MPLKALNDRIIVEPETVEEKTTGGIIIPDTVKGKETQNMHKGTVLSVGPGMKTISGEVVIPQVQIGDVIVYEPHAKTEVEVNKKKFHLIRAEDVMAKWEDEQTQS